jgi:thiamine monophosphate synthase
MTKLSNAARRLNFKGAAKRERRPRHARADANARPAAARGRLPALILMTDETRTPDPVAAARALPRGAAVILRHYSLAPAARERLARALRRVTRARGQMLLIAGDARLALRVSADGVHWPEHLVGRALRWSIARARGLWITAAAHGAAAALQAARTGADAVLVGPVFPTRSHPGAGGLGVPRLARIVRMVGAGGHGGGADGIAVYALGGIDDTTVRRLAGAGCAGFAAIGALVADGG